MPYFSTETLEAVRSIPLYEVVRPVVDLSRSGKNWRGLSPFTNEKTPSFYVLTDRNLFKCHSSGLSGDSITFLRETEKLTFPEAVEALAERFNLPVTYASGAGPDPRERSLRQELHAIHEEARDYYHRAFLAGNAAAQAVRAYWIEGRGFSMELAETFSIGFSPPSGNGLLERLRKKGFGLEALRQSGLFRAGYRPNDPASWHPVFQGRLMVPIRDLQGQVVAFTARQLDQTPRDHASWKAKYINSPNTPVFQKGQLLFNLDRAREAGLKAGRFLMVEGQLDALRCWEAGLLETIATQGTSVTREQVQLIRRYVNRLDVLLDSDAAGQRAILSILPLAFQAGLAVRAATLPEGTDPDDFFREQGSAGAAALNWESALRFAARSLSVQAGPGPEEQARMLHQLFEIIQECSSAVVREAYFDELVDSMGLPRAAALEDFRRFLQSKDPTARRGQAAAARPSAPSQPPRGTNPSQSLTKLERDLLWAVLHRPGCLDALAQVIDQEWIVEDSPEGRILRRLFLHLRSETLSGSGEIYGLLESDEERDCFNELLLEDRTGSMETFLNLTIAALTRRVYHLQLTQIDQQMEQFDVLSGDVSRVRFLMLRRQELLRYLADQDFPKVRIPE